MSRLFYHVMQDNAGNLLFDVSGTMRLAGTGTAATIYGDEALTIPIANPMTNHPSFGSFKCFLGPGDYDFYMAKSGYTFETLTGVQGHGTMAQQDATSVAITGGGITGLSALSANANANAQSWQVLNRSGNDVVALYSGVLAAGGTNRYSIQTADAPALLGGTLQVSGSVGIATAPQASYRVVIRFVKAGTSAIMVQPSDADGGGGGAMVFLNQGGTLIGSIATTSTTTSYGTSSDARLKHAVTPLAGALAVVQALRPVAFRWRSNDEPGHGFLASEVEDVVPGVITGTRDAVDAQGNIAPQQIDPSKLVVWLVSALQETLAQVQTLTARVVSLEGARGV